MAIEPRNRSERPGWSGYVLAILVSALGHAGFLAFALLILPQWLHSATVAPPSMTVKIVDNIPAGDLGTHLPKLAGHKKPPPPEEVAKADEPPPPEEKPPEPAKPDDDKNAVALNTIGPTPTPTPEPTPAPTEAPTVAPTVAMPTPTETPQKVAEPAPTPPPPPPAKKHHEKVVVHNPPPKPKPKQVAKAEKPPDVHEQFRKLQERMLKQRIEMAKKDEGDEEDTDEDETASEPPSSNAGGPHGPVLANTNTGGSGYGIGSGTGSAGTLMDMQYLLYFRTVQQKVKDAWTFPGGSNDLSADVEFSISADGALNGVKIAKGSGDSAFDESVMRAIRRAAPFPPPPDRYRSQFSDIVATFKLGELKS